MIGVFDSGSGGLTVLAALLERLPDRRFAYLGDHLRAPYGDRSADDVLAFTRDGVAALFEHGCRLVVVACNTACALALRSLQEAWLSERYPDRRLLGVFVPIIEALTERPWDRDDDRADPAPAFDVAVFATAATVRSGAFGREIRRRLPNVRVREQACPGLVDLIEHGAETAEIDAAVAGFVGQATVSELGPPDRVVLGCTHYPLVSGSFERALPSGTSIVGQPRIVADSLARYLDRRPNVSTPSRGSNCDVTLLTTGDPERVTRRIAPVMGRCEGLRWRPV